MRNSMRNEYQMRMMRSLIDTGKKYIELGLKSLIPKGPVGIDLDYE